MVTDLLSVPELLVKYGHRTAASGLCAGTGGNISAREGDVVWMKPTGVAMDELAVDQLCGLRVIDGRQCAGTEAPTSEYRLHLAVYRVRPDVLAVLHTHPPWLTGVISAGVPFRMLTIEAVGYLGRIVHLSYSKPQSQALAQQVADAARTADTLLLSNHGMVTTGATLREAFHRSMVAEDTAKSVIAACLVGKPQFLTDEQITEIVGQ